MLCPNCSKEIKSDEEICPHCKEVIMQEVAENWKAEIEQVVLGYDIQRGLVHGLQKDAIQNGWGHRLHKKGKDWEFVFKLIKWKKNEYLLTMTDSGGHGLTGENMKTHEIPDELSEDERLARFEHMYFSGGATQGAGLFGRGKLLFTAASKDHYIIYDSLTDDGTYRLNKRKLSGRKLENFAKAYEGTNARHMLEELTENQLKPLKISGTRVTIVNPKEEIIKNIKNGTFLKYIEETWWQILQKSENPKICIETEDKKEYAKSPKEFKNLPPANAEKWKAKLIQPVNMEYEGRNLKIKKIHFIVSPDPVAPETLGVYLYRREMKVADMELKDIPAEIRDKFYGFVEMETNSDLEKLYLEEKIEGPEHYSINKNRGLARKLRKTVQLEFDKFKDELGYGINAIQATREKTERILKEALEELHKRMNNLGISIGKITIQKDIKITLEEIKLPSTKNIVDIGDKIEDIKFKIENRANRKHNLNIKICTIDSNGKEVEKFIESNITLNEQETKILNSFSFKIEEGRYPAKGKIVLSCIIKDVLSNKTLGSKYISIYIAEEPPRILDPIEIDLEKIVFPRGFGNRRVNYGESVKTIVYSMTNNLNEKIKARFKVKILDAKSKIEIQSLHIEDIVLDVFKNAKINCPDINVIKELYGVLDRERGPVVLRASVVALENSENGTFSKGDKLAKLDLRIWINMDSGKGVFEESRGYEGGPEEPRSKIKPEGQGYIFFLNETYPAYEVLNESSDESSIRSYTYEQLLRQTLKLLLVTDKIEYWPDILNKKYKEDIISKDADKHETIESCLSTIDYLYADYLR
jgi:hypothetical protein